MRGHGWWQNPPMTEHPAPQVRSIALVTAAGYAELDDDLAPLVAACEAAGLSVATPVWDDPSVDWASFELVVLRSTWDYMARAEEFLDWLDATAARTRVANRPDAVRWSTDKHYLLDLAAAGVPIIPTRIVEADEPTPDEDVFAGEVVVKPAVGAGSKDAARHTDPAAARAHCARLQARGAAVVVQPYLVRIDEAGETAVVWFGGEISHAFRKGPILRPDEPPTAEKFAPEVIASRVATEDERSVATAAVAAAPPDLLYARVDLVLDDDGAPVVLELELAEPSFFVAYSDGSADRFAAAVVRALG